MSDKEKNKKEEVDLGLLFSLFASAFNKIVNAIKGLFQAVFHAIIYTLLFIKKYSIKMLIVMAIGFVVGYTQENDTSYNYQGELVVQTNYGSSRQLYKDIRNYQNLIDQQDIHTLASSLELSEAQASSLISFKIVPVNGVSNLINAVRNLGLVQDTVVDIDYTYYKGLLSDYDYENHKIIIESNDTRVFKHLTEPIIASINTDKSYVKLRELKKKNITAKKQFIANRLNAVDSLRGVYNSTMLRNPLKQNAGEPAIINMAETNNRFRELDLFETESEIYNELEVLQEEEIESSVEIITILASFKEVGKRITVYTSKAYIIYPVIALIIMLLLIGLKALNAYLNQYDKA